jgi:hypothetical protein
MADAVLDFAILGSTPLAGLVAGLLASVHGKRVCLVAEPWSPFRLPRRHDVSVAPATRPETWAQLRALTTESRRLLATLGKGVSERIDPLFVADLPESADALSHMRHMAAAYGYAVERVADRAAAETGATYRVRDAVALVGGRIEPAIGAWLERHGVRSFPTAATAVTLRRDGTARLVLAGEIAEAARVVLADDEAILRHLDPEERERVLVERRMTAILTEPARPLAAPMITYLDRDVALTQRPKGGILVLAGGSGAEAEQRVGACFGALSPLRRVGQTSFTTLASRDAAPLAGTVRGQRAIVLAGFGATGAFLAPALARYLAGAATESEAAYFAARGPARGTARRPVADFARARVLEAQS